MGLQVGRSYRCASASRTRRSKTESCASGDRRGISWDPAPGARRPAAPSWDGASIAEGASGHYPRLLALLLVWLALAPPAAAQTAPSAAASRVAPTGALRVALLVTNPNIADKDPATGAVRGVAAVAPEIPTDQARQVVNANGMLVVPGLVDAHVHVFEGVSHYGINPDQTCLAHGATTVVDAGSAGADTFDGFRKYVIETSDTRILAHMNISVDGDDLAPDR